MTTPATITNDMETAFHSLLERVEEMGLNEGNYLKMTDILKKSFEASKAPEKTILAVHNLNQKLIFHGKTDIVIELITETFYVSCPNMVEYKLNGNTRKVPRHDLSNGFAVLLRSNITESITIEVLGISTKSTLRELMKQLAEEVMLNNSDDDDDDDEHTHERLTLSSALYRLIML